MSKSWSEIDQELLHMLREEEAVREALASTGELFHGYHPAMEKAHLKHAKRLQEIIDESGFPTLDHVSPEASDAALKLLTHAISWPEFLRSQEGPLEDLAKSGKVSKKLVAALIDRIRYYEGRRQIYGTNKDWDENGILRITDVEDEAQLNERRATMDLEPLNTLVITPLSGDFHPPTPQKRYQEFIDWTRKVGWRNY